MSLTPAIFSVATAALSKELVTELASKGILLETHPPDAAAALLENYISSLDSSVRLPEDNRPFPSFPDFVSSYKCSDVSIEGSDREAQEILAHLETKKSSYLEGMKDVKSEGASVSGVKRGREAPEPVKTDEISWTLSNPTLRLMMHVLGDHLIGGTLAEGFNPLSFFETFLPHIEALSEHEDFDKSGFIAFLKELKLRAENLKSVSFFDRSFFINLFLEAFYSSVGQCKEICDPEKILAEVDKRFISHLTSSSYPFLNNRPPSDPLILVWMDKVLEEIVSYLGGKSIKFSQSDSIKETILVHYYAIAFREIKKAIHPLVTSLAESLDRLEVGKTTWIPTGFIGTQFGHFVVLGITKNLDETWNLKFFNTGHGTQYHPQTRISISRTYVTPYIEFESVPTDLLLIKNSAGTPTLLEHFYITQVPSIFEYMRSHGFGELEDYFYKKILLFLGSYQVFTEKATSSALAPQKAGTCVYRSTKAALQQFCKSNLAYKKVVWKLKKRLLLEGLKSFESIYIHSLEERFFSGLRTYQSLCQSLIDTVYKERKHHNTACQELDDAFQTALTCRTWAIKRLGSIKETPNITGSKTLTSAHISESLTSPLPKMNLVKHLLELGNALISQGHPKKNPITKLLNRIQQKKQTGADMMPCPPVVKCPTLDFTSADLCHKGIQSIRDLLRTNSTNTSDFASKNLVAIEQELLKLPFPQTGFYSSLSEYSDFADCLNTCIIELIFPTFGHNLLLHGRALQAKLFVILHHLAVTHYPDLFADIPLSFCDFENKYFFKDFNFSSDIEMDVFEHCINYVQEFNKTLSDSKDKPFLPSDYLFHHSLDHRVLLSLSGDSAVIPFAEETLYKRIYKQYPKIASVLNKEAVGSSEYAKTAPLFTYPYYSKTHLKNPKPDYFENEIELGDLLCALKNTFFALTLKKTEFNRTSVAKWTLDEARHEFSYSLDFSSPYQAYLPLNSSSNLLSALYNDEIGLGKKKFNFRACTPQNMKQRFLGFLLENDDCFDSLQAGVIAELICFSKIEKGNFARIISFLAEDGFHQLNDPTITAIAETLCFGSTPSNPFGNEFLAQLSENQALQEITFTFLCSNLLNYANRFVNSPKDFDSYADEPLRKGLQFLIDFAFRTAPLFDQDLYNNYEFIKSLRILYEFTDRKFAAHVISTNLVHLTIAVSKLLPLCDVDKEGFLYEFTHLTRIILHTNEILDNHWEKNALVTHFNRFLDRNITLLKDPEIALKLAKALLPAYEKAINSKLVSAVYDAGTHQLWMRFASHEEIRYCFTTAMPLAVSKGVLKSLYDDKPVDPASRIWLDRVENLSKQSISIAPTKLNGPISTPLGEFDLYSYTLTLHPFQQTFLPKLLQKIRWKPIAAELFELRADETLKGKRLNLDLPILNRIPWDYLNPSEVLVPSNEPENSSLCTPIVVLNQAYEPCVLLWDHPSLPESKCYDLIRKQNLSLMPLKSPFDHFANASRIAIENHLDKKSFLFFDQTGLVFSILEEGLRLKEKPEYCLNLMRPKEIPFSTRILCFKHQTDLSAPSIVYIQSAIYSNIGFFQIKETPAPFTKETRSLGILCYTLDKGKLIPDSLLGKIYLAYLHALSLNESEFFRITRELLVDLELVKGGPADESLAINNLLGALLECLAKKAGSSPLLEHLVLVLAPSLSETDRDNLPSLDLILATYHGSNPIPDHEKLPLEFLSALKISHPYNLTDSDTTQQETFKTAALIRHSLVPILDYSTMSIVINEDLFFKELTDSSDIKLYSYSRFLKTSKTTTFKNLVARILAASEQERNQIRVDLLELIALNRARGESYGSQGVVDLYFLLLAHTLDRSLDASMRSVIAPEAPSNSLSALTSSIALLNFSKVTAALKAYFTQKPLCSHVYPAYIERALKTTVCGITFFNSHPKIYAKITRPTLSSGACTLESELFSVVINPDLNTWTVRYLANKTHEFLLNLAEPFFIKPLASETPSTGPLSIRAEKLKDLEALTHRFIEHLNRFTTRAETALLFWANTQVVLGHMREEDEALLAILKESSFAKTLTLDDLVKLFLRQSSLIYLDGFQMPEQLVNPEKGPESFFQQLFNATGHVLILKILQNKLESACLLLQKDPGDPETLKTLNHLLLTQKRLSIAPIHQIVFEYLSGLHLSQNQIEILNYFLDNKAKNFSRKAAQIVMGGGKTSVIAPLLASIKSNGTKTTLFITPTSQKTAVFSTLKTQQKRFFNQKVIDLCIHRSEMSSANLESFLKSLTSSENDLIVASPETFQSLELEFLHRLHKHRSSHPILAQILLYLRNNTEAIVDELSAISDVSKLTNFPISSAETRFVPLEEDKIKFTKDLFRILILDEIEPFLGLKKNQQMFVSHLAWTKGILPLIAEKLIDLHFKEGARLSLSKSDLLQFFIDPTQTARTLEKLSSQQSDPFVEKLCLSHFLLTTLLPSLFKKKAGRHFGRSLNPKTPGKIVPYQGVGSPSTTEFGFHYETLCYHFIHVIQSGIKAEHVTEVMDHLLGIAKQKSSARHTSIESSDEAKLLESLTGMNIYDKDDPEAFKRCMDRLNDDFEKGDFDKLLTLEMILAGKYVGYHPKYLSSNPHNLFSQLGAISGFTGTPWNHPTYGYSFQESLYLDTSIEQELNRTFIHKPPISGTGLITSYVNSDPTAILSSLKSTLSSSDFDRIEAFIDTGGLFKDFENRQVAERLCDYYATTFPKKQIQVIYFDRENPHSLADTPHTLSKDPITRAYKKAPLASLTSEYLTSLGLTPSNFKVYFDERHTMGIDIALSKDAIGIVTLDEKLTYNQFAQGILRLRKYPTSQNAILVAQRDVVTSNPSAFTSRESFLDFLLKNQTQILSSLLIKSYKQQLHNAVRNAVMNALLISRDPSSLYHESSDLFLFSMEDTPYNLVHESLRISDAYKSLELYAASVLAQYPRSLGTIPVALTREIQQILKHAKDELLLKEVREDVRWATSHEVTLETHLETQKEVEKHIDLSLQTAIDLYSSFGEDLPEGEVAIKPAAIVAHFSTSEKLYTDPDTQLSFTTLAEHTKLLGEHKKSSDYTYRLALNHLILSSNAINVVTIESQTLFCPYLEKINALLGVLNSKKELVYVGLTASETDQFIEYLKEHPDSCCLLFNLNRDLLVPSSLELLLQSNHKTTSMAFVEALAFNHAIPSLIKYPEAIYTWLNDETYGDTRKTFLKIQTSLFDEMPQLDLVEEMASRASLELRLFQNNQTQKELASLSLKTSSSSTHSDEHVRILNVVKKVPRHQIDLVPPPLIPYLSSYQVHYITDQKALEALTEEQRLATKESQRKLAALSPLDATLKKTRAIKHSTLSHCDEPMSKRSSTLTMEVLYAAQIPSPTDLKTSPSSSHSFGGLIDEYEALTAGKSDKELNALHKKAMETQADQEMLDRIFNSDLPPDVLPKPGSDPMMDLD